MGNEVFEAHDCTAAASRRSIAMKRMLRCISVLLFLLLPLFCGPVAAAVSISVTGAWYETLDKNDLSFGAGSDLQDTHTSISGQITIDISGASGPNDAWRVEIHKIDGGWNGLLRPWARRTSDGAGGSVAGGTAFQAVTDVNTEFFSGAGNVSGIKIQLRLTGASVQIPPSSCSTTFYYSVIDVP